MKKHISVLFAALLILAELPCITAGAVQAPETSAKAAVLISADTGEIVCGENYSEKLPMASTTKIMTALLCIESGGLDQQFTVDSQAIRVEGSSMGLREGDTVTKYALCCGMLLPSGNDAANAAAVRIAGSIPAFAELMNSRARELGMSRTWFVTPSGLDGEGHGSCAYDMAILAAAALRNDTFREICSSETIKLEFGDPPYTRWLRNTNKLLSMYTGTYGVKTGFTDDAGRCLVSACERGGKRLICVTLNDRNDWNDHMALYDYGFGAVDTFEPELPADMAVPVAGGASGSVKLTLGGEPLVLTTAGASQEDMDYTVISAPYVYAPVSAGDALAELSISFRGREIRRIPLYSAEDVEYMQRPARKKSLFERIKSILSHKAEGKRG